MKVGLFTGSRHAEDIDPELVGAIVGFADLCIQGGAPGLDALVRRECRRQHTLCEEFAVDWSEGGPARNTRMVVRALECHYAGEHVRTFGFPGPQSRGTWDCLVKSFGCGLQTYVVRDGELVEFELDMAPARYRARSIRR